MPVWPQTRIPIVRRIPNSDETINDLLSINDQVRADYNANR